MTVDTLHRYNNSLSLRVGTFCNELQCPNSYPFTAVSCAYAYGTRTEIT